MHFQINRNVGAQSHQQLYGTTKATIVDYNVFATSIHLKYYGALCQNLYVVLFLFVWIELNSIKQYLPWHLHNNKRLISNLQKKQIWTKRHIAVYQNYDLIAQRACEISVWKSTETNRTRFFFLKNIHFCCAVLCVLSICEHTINDRLKSGFKNYNQLVGNQFILFVRMTAE